MGEGNTSQAAFAALAQCHMDFRVCYIAKILQQVNFQSVYSTRITGTILICLIMDSKDPTGLIWMGRGKV